MATAHINIGSNLGDSRAYLARAVAGVALLSEDCKVQVSDIIESEPWGFTSSHRFLNVGMNIHTTLCAPELMERLHSVERSISDAPHRHADGSYADRTVDIDLICLDDTVVRQPGIEVPHPRLHLREFVLRPLIQLWPQWVHPQLRLTPAEMLAGLKKMS